jgi:hypothetical protein
VKEVSYFFLEAFLVVFLAAFFAVFLVAFFAVFLALAAIFLSIVDGELVLIRLLLVCRSRFINHIHRSVKGASLDRNFLLRATRCRIADDPEGHASLKWHRLFTRSSSH